MSQSQLHVLYIITKLELGGAQKICLSLFNELGNNTTTFLLTGSDGPLISHINNKNNSILIDTLTREIKISRFFHELKNFFLIVKHIRALKKKYPALIIHTHSTKAGIIGRWAALCAGVNYRVHTIHGYGFHEHQSRSAWCSIFLLEFFTSLITTHFICVSHNDQKTGAQLFPFFKKKSSLIRAAIDPDFGGQTGTSSVGHPLMVSAQHSSLMLSLSKHAAKRRRVYRTTAGKQDECEKFIFGTIACFKPQKNIQDLLYAFAATHQKNNNMHLEIIGDGILRQELESLLITLNIQHAVTLHGWKNSVYEIMRTWHAFVLTSLWEGLPCAVVEARAMKIPVISYDTGGINELIKNGVNGFLYQQKDWQALSQGMLTLSRDIKLYNSLCNYDDQLHEFRISTMIERHKRLYMQLSQNSLHPSTPLRMSKKLS